MPVKRATGLRAMAKMNFELTDSYLELMKTLMQQVCRYQQLAHKYTNEGKQCLSEAKKLEKKARKKKAQQNQGQKAAEGTEGTEGTEGK